MTEVTNHVTNWRTLQTLHTDEWNQMIDVNIKGVLNGIATALPQMRKQCAGHIINISSIAAHGINVGGAVYSVTKAAVNMIVKRYVKRKPWLKVLFGCRLFLQELSQQN
ncbi:SDR family oxidoreductase [Peribacillus frigoritolerans]|uniref:SDR family oxidoreductase n=1 Tax=Peribacillus frigoritolerans TaxID=450367 RepID=UPI0034E05A69